jgi:hypothetical protein
MKTIGAAARIFLFVLLLVEAGCDPADIELPLLFKDESGLAKLAPYGPVKVDIMPLTEFVYAGNGQEEPKIKAYVSLLDTFNCQIKTPAVFRFELYERVLRSAEPKGKRIFIWPDIDLTNVVENNKHWRDFLRAYEFNLDLEPVSSQDYMLQVTCLCPSGKRLSAEFGLKHTK